MKKLSSLFITFVLLGSSLSSPAEPVECTSAQVEIPAHLTDRPELIIHHYGYTVSYNTLHNTPNWVAWMLTSTMVQSDTLTRTNVFLADPCVPTPYRVLPSDYTNSDYDRGHMCPAADMAYSKESMNDCFYMSNMAPQVPTLNRIYWKQLEDACRKWIMSEDTMYIVAGPVYTSSHCKKIGRSHIIDVPDGYFKVILSLT